MTHPAPNPLPQKPSLGLYGGAILYAAPQRWDEACFSVPALRAICLARPLATVGVICHYHQIPLWRSVPGVRAVISYNDSTSMRKLIAQEQSSRHGWDCAILWEDGMAARFCEAMKLKQRLGYAEKSLDKWLTDAVPLVSEPGPVVHRVLHYLRFMETLQVPTRVPQIFTPCAMDVTRQERHVVVCPASDFGASHVWTSDGWSQVVRFLLERWRASVTIVSLPGVRDAITQELVAKFPGCELKQPDTWADAMELVGSAVMCVAADSSLCHLSAFVGTTTVSLFGPNDPQWRRPLGVQHAYVHQKVECSPCLMAKCSLDRRCQNELAHEKVIAMIQRKWPSITA
jgi:ADP-heptose:LPS heptosyltransferase